MPIMLKGSILTAFCFLSILNSGGQIVKFSGQAAGWMTINSSPGFNFQTGLRYIPKLSLNIPVNGNINIDGEMSADGFASYTCVADSSCFPDADANFYRLWLRLSGKRFEIRAGLQKINFGSASMLRPLMWFDRIDPRDPLELTAGVYGLQGKYFFKNNASIWLWTLIGNRKTKGWEQMPSLQWRPEFGGRVQFPVPKGEFAISYHNRSAEFPDDWQLPVTGSRKFPENRLGLDFKLDLGVGLWFEGSVTHQRQDDIPPFETALTVGADYTLGIGNGLTLTAEHLLFNSSDRFFSGGSVLSFTGVSASVPLSIITRVSSIFFYDWKNRELYSFANFSFTFDKWAINLIGFMNPDNFRIFNYNSGLNLFAGKGGQVMVVYNY